MIIMKTEPGYIFQQFKDKNLSLLGEMRDSFLLYLSRLTSFLLYLTRLTSVHISYLYCFFFQLMQVFSFQRAISQQWFSTSFFFPSNFFFTNSTYVCVCVCLHATHTQTPQDLCHNSVCNKTSAKWTFCACYSACLAQNKMPARKENSCSLCHKANFTEVVITVSII